jgi:hypothetical protein
MQNDHQQWYPKKILQVCRLAFSVDAHIVKHQNFIVDESGAIIWQKEMKAAAVPLYSPTVCLNSKQYPSFGVVLHHLMFRNLIFLF